MNDAHSASAAGSEAVVVEALCAGAGGMRPQPTQEQLRTFLQQAAHLDAETLALVLSQQLVSPAWQTRVRALAAIQAAAEAVSSSGGDHPFALVVASFASMPETFDGVLTHANPAVRQAARSCAVSLGFAAAGGTEAATATAASAATAEAVGDLLGGMEEPQADTQRDGAQGTGSLGDLLGGDAVAPSGAASASAADLLGGLDDLGAGSAPAPPKQTAAAQPPRASAPVGDMFAGLDLSSGAPAHARASDLETDPFEGFPGATAAPPPDLGTQLASAPAAAQAVAQHAPALQPPAASVRPFAGSHAPSNTGPGAWPGAHAGAGPMGPADASVYRGMSQQAPGMFANAQPSAAIPPAPTNGSVPGQTQRGQPPFMQPVSNFAGSGRALGNAPSRPKDAFDFVNDAM